MNKNSHKHKLWEFGTQCAQNVIGDLVLSASRRDCKKDTYFFFFFFSFQWLLYCAFVVVQTLSIPFHCSNAHFPTYCSQNHVVSVPNFGNIIQKRLKKKRDWKGMINKRPCLLSVVLLTSGYCWSKQFTE